MPTIHQCSPAALLHCKPQNDEFAATLTNVSPISNTNAPCMSSRDAVQGGKKTGHVSCSLHKFPVPRYIDKVNWRISLSASCEGFSICCLPAWTSLRIRALINNHTNSVNSPLPHFCTWQDLPLTCGSFSERSKSARQNHDFNPIQNSRIPAHGASQFSPPNRTTVSQKQNRYPSTWFLPLYPWRIGKKCISHTFS